MTVAAAPASPTAPVGGGLVRRRGWARIGRAWSGAILFAFVATHLLNHAAGVFGIHAMEIVQEWRWAVWKTWPGAILLYGAALVHIVLTMQRVVRRRTWRMPRVEAWQIVSGLSIPFLIVGHVLQTRFAGSWYGADESYHTVLFYLWPAAAFSQTVLLTASWTHGVIGLHQLMRYRPWFPPLRLPGLLVATLVPFLALAGFAASGREARSMPSPKQLAAEQMANMEMARATIRVGLGGVGAALFALIAVSYVRRRTAATVTVNYRGHGRATAPRGASILETSQINRIPHPSACRGRGRCSTCRVQILSDPTELPDPFGDEQRLLARIGASANVRLACQLRPTTEVSVRILMPVLGRRTSDEAEPELREWAVELTATVLCLDLRAFNTLTRKSQPYEIAVLVNRFSSEMTQAVEDHGGRVDQMDGHGLIAVFDEPAGRASARNALHAARDMTRVLDLLNAELGLALPIPIRGGIGIHTGPLVLTRLGDGVASASLRAFGDTITIAAGLEAASKELLADYIVSEATAELAGFDFSYAKSREIMIEGGDRAVAAYAVSDQAALERIMGGKTIRRALAAAGV